MAPNYPAMPMGRRRRTRLVLAAGVLLFLIIDVALVGFALTRDDSPQAAVTAGPIPTFEATSSPIPSPTPGPTLQPAAVSTPRFLVAVSDSVGWRATVGNCTGQDAVVESTDDGGASWNRVVPPDVHQILAMSADNGSVTLVSRSGGACGLDLVRSFTGGEFWKSYPDEIAGYALVDPSDRGTIHTIDGPVQSPCLEASEVQERDGAIAVNCGAQLFESTEATNAWLSVPVPGLLAMAPNDNGYTLAVSSPADCAGISIETVPGPIGSGSPTILGCIADDVDPSEVSISQLGSSVWLWSADRFFVSSDGGLSWG